MKQWSTNMDCIPHISRRGFLHTMAAGAAALALPARADGAASRRPNFVFVLVDDLGWADLGCYGSTYYETPNIDKLAADGMRFTQAYAAAPVCSPTRASILTGKHPARLHFTEAAGCRPPAKTLLAELDWRRRLPLEEVTLAEALKPAGYATACFGKWHIGPHRDVSRQGFGETAGRGKKRGDKSTAFLTDKAIAFITKNAAKPFFLYLSHYTVHVPLEADSELVKKYRKKAPGKNGQCNPTMAAMIETLDTQFGRLRETLKDAGVDKNTVIVFFSDNGGLPRVKGKKGFETATSNLPLRGGKSNLYEGGIREPLIVYAPGVTKAGAVETTPVLSTDFYPTFLELANLPLRPDQHQDGCSLLPLLRGRPLKSKRPLVWHYPHYHSTGRPHGAIRIGDEKLIEWYEDGRRELYDLSKDVGEKDNLADQRPDRIQELGDLLHRELDRMKAQRMKRRSSR